MYQGYCADLYSHAIICYRRIDKRLAVMFSQWHTERNKKMRRYVAFFVVLLAVFLTIGNADIANSEPNLPDDNALAERASAVLDHYCSGDMSPYEKIYNVYNYICQSVTYDWSVQPTGWDGVSIGYGQTAYEALCQEKAVCAGISEAVDYLLYRTNIPCITIVGTLNGIPHSWNAVKLDNYWYYLDATSDLGSSYYNYFLKPLNYLPSKYSISAESSEELNDCIFSETPYKETIEAQFDTVGSFVINPGFGNVTIYTYIGTEANVVIPAEINDRPVKHLNSGVFQYNDTIETLTISEGIERIDHLFVNHCSKLKSISIPASAEYLSPNSGMFRGGGGFLEACEALETITVAQENPYLCSVENVLYNKERTMIICYPSQIRNAVLQVPDGVITIEDSAFSNNHHLQQVILPDSVEIIGYWAFTNCSALQKINIPNNCYAIGQFAFSNTIIFEIHIPAATEIILSPAFPETLAIITVNDNNPVYYAADNILFSRNGELLRYGSRKANSTYSVPQGVAIIRQRAFENVSALKNVILPEGVTCIETGAFMCCRNLNTVILPETLDSIAASAFIDCHSLGMLTLPSSLQSIPDDILTTTSGVVLFVDDGSVAHNWAIRNGYAYHINGSDWNVSGSCGENIIWRLDEKGLLNVTGTGRLGDFNQSPWHLYANYIKRCNISEGITYIGMNTFPYCGAMQSVKLPFSLEELGGAFPYCYSLEKVFVGNNLYRISEYAFFECDNVLLSIFNNNNVLNYAIEYNIPYHLVCSMILPDGIKTIESEAFSGSACEAVIIPTSCEIIESRAFANCQNLIYVYIPSGIVNIAEDAFADSPYIYLDNMN